MKRSSQVVLLCLGAAATGAGAYAFTRPNCAQPALPQGASAEAVAAAATAERECRNRSSGTGYYRSYYHSYYPFARTNTATGTGIGTGTNNGLAVPFVKGARPGIAPSTQTSSSRGGFGFIGRAFSRGS